MIERKDYILVQVNAIGLLITKLLGLKESRNAEQMRSAINETMKATGFIDLDLFDDSLKNGSIDTLVLLQLQQALRIYLSVETDAHLQRAEESVTKHLLSKDIYTYPVD